MLVIKRDGREVLFEPEKIYNAILKAFKNPKYTDQDKHLAVSSILQTVLRAIPVSEKIGIESIQDVVEQALIKNNYPEEAKEYILYRQHRSNIRNSNRAITKTLKDLMVVDAKDMDEKRENANIDGNSTMGIMLKIGGTLTKDIFLNQLTKPELAALHKEGKVHLHDLDFAALCWNCLNIPLGKLLKSGFATGHGFLRPPQTIGSAATLACIVVQSDQNEQFGGQSIPLLDYYLAPYVAKSYVRNCAEYIEIVTLDSKKNTFNSIKEEFTAPLIEYIDEHEHILTDEGKDLINHYFDEQIANTLDPNEAWTKDIKDKMHEWALKKTERDTYQAMEAMIHNFCTLQCLPSYEKVWAYDTRYKQWVIITASELCRQFTEGRYLALSVNPKTGKAEAKPITKVWASENTKPMVKVTDIAGNSIIHTFDHRHMTITDDCKIVYREPKDLQYTTIARDFTLPTEREFNYIDISMNTKRNDWSSTLASDLNQLEYSKELAEFLGYYVGDGYIPIHETCINFATDQKVPVEHYKELCITLFGFEPIISVYDRPYQNNPRERVPAHINISLGVKICRAIKKLAGSMAQFKYVPDFVLHGPLEYQQAFLTAYLTCDGCKTKKYVEFTTASQYLIYDLKLMLAARGELLHVSTVKKQMKAHHLQLYTGILGRKAAERLGLDTACARDGTDFEIPKYDLNHCVKAIKKAGIPWGDLPRIPRRNKSNNENSSGLRYHELKLIDMPDDLRAKLEPMEHLFRIKVKSIEHLNEYCPVVYDIEVADNENFTMANGLVVHNSRAGAQPCFSNVNFGTDTSEEGRMISKQLLLASDAGLGAGETAIFPITVFKIKKGVTDKGSPNYDLFKLSCKVSAKRGFPNHINLSSSFNEKYYIPGHPETEASAMGCRTRVISNVYDPSRQVVPGRGNLFFITMNLPYLALEVKESLGKEFDIMTHEERYLAFEKALDKRHDQIFQLLDDRFEIIAKRKAKNYPFLVGQHLYLDSEKLEPDDEIREMIKHGSLVTGILGLAEMLVVLFGKHHGESEESQEYGLRMMRHLNDRCSKRAEQKHLNYGVMGSPAEGCTGRLLRLTRKRFGVIPGVTDHEYFVNSHHLPPYFKTTIQHKIDVEAPYHALEPSGQISYVEISDQTAKNVDAFEAIINYMCEKDMGYISINHPMDRDPICGYMGYFPDDRCPRCGRKDGEGVPAYKLMELKSYSPDPRYAVKKSMIEEENETTINE